MQKRFLVLTSFLSLIALTAFSYKGFDFIAPVVPGTSFAPDEVGLIVFDSNTNSFYGRGTDSSPNDWLQLNNSTGDTIPAGTLLPFAGPTAPTGYIPCDGRALSRTVYSNLFSAIGTAYGEGDGSSTFNIPDLRGRFLRGLDDGAGNDPDASTRTASGTGGNTGDNVGSLQTDELSSHTHSSPSYYMQTNGGGYSVGGGSSLSINNNLTINSTGGNETRPKNVAVNYIIKY